MDEFKQQLFTRIDSAPILNMDEAIIQKISDMLPLKRWSAITSSVCNWMKDAYWKGRPAQMLLSLQRPTSFKDGNFNELREHHWQFGRMKIYQPHELTTSEAHMHALQCQLPKSYVFEPWFQGHSGPKITTEQLCLDHLAWLQNTNRYDFQYYVFGEKVRNMDMFTGHDSLSPLVEVNEVMLQAQKMGEFGQIENPQFPTNATPVIEHIFIDAYPPQRQDQIRTATLREAMDRPFVLWDARRRFPPRFSTNPDDKSIYFGGIDDDLSMDADAAFAQRLQNAIDEKDIVVYSKRKLQMQEDAEYAQSLAAAEASLNGAGNHRKTRAISHQQQMASVNDQANLQSRLDSITPLSAMSHNEECELPIPLNQLEELEEVIHGQPYQPDQYSQANVIFHGSAPEGSPAEMHGEDSD